MSSAMPPSGPLPAGRMSRLAAAVSDGLRSTIAWLPLAALLALSPALFLWPLLHRDRLGYVLDNRLPPADRYALITAVLASLCFGGAAYAVMVARAARAAPDASLRSLGSALNRKLLWLLALPLLPPLSLSGLSSRSPFITLLLVALIAGVLGVWLYALSLGGGQPVSRRRFPALAIVLGCVVAHGAFFSWLAVQRHDAFDTRIFDLGIYDNILWYSSHGAPLGSSFVRAGSHVSAHVDPILLLLAPLYRLAPRAETLLVFQAFWLASGAIPLFLLSDAALEAPLAALLIALCYLLHPALHGACLFDFHSLSLAIPLVLWALHALGRGHARGFGVAVALLLLTREDAAFLVGGIALCSLLSGRRASFGLAALIAAVAYLAAVKLFVMPRSSLLMQDSASSYSYESFYADLIPIEGEGALGLLGSLLSNPAFVLAHVLAPQKWLFVLVMFLPTLGLPALAGPGRVMLVYGLAFTLLSSRPAVHQIGFQYVAVLLPFAFALVPPALASLRARAPFGLDGARLGRALLACLLVSGALVSWKFGAILPNRAFHAGGLVLSRPPDARVAATRAALGRALAKIPTEASLAVGDRLGPHASNRRRVERFMETSSTDYILVEPELLIPPDRARLDHLRHDGSHEVLLEDAGVLLLHKLAAPPPRP